MRRIIFFSFLLVMVLLVSTCKTEGQQDEEIWTAIDSKNFSGARYLVGEYYQNDRLKAVSWMVTIRGEENEDYLKNVVVVEGWKWSLKGNYSYITGSVKNTGNKTINYFKVTVHFRDSGKNIIDTSYTNSSETLRPGMAKSFEIMHRYSSDNKSAITFVEEVSVE